MRKVVLIALIWGFSSSCAWAQDDNPTTPGAIPDPSTYQGSMELQRQSDEQSQQQYQQQFGQPQQQYEPQQSYGGTGYYGGGGGYSGRSTARGGYSAAPGGRSYTPDQCFERIAQFPRFLPLAGKIELGPVGERSGGPTQLGTHPTPAEKVLLRRWMLERHYCGTLWDAQSMPPRIRSLNLRYGWRATENLIRALIAGQLTFGEFNRRRMDYFRAYLRGR